MRLAFINTLLELAARDPRVMLLTGDLGFTVLEPFAEQFPRRFINAGIAEQNMVGMATGLAEAGFIPFVYSIAPFISLRPYEFIRNGPVLHRLPVRIIGVGGGFDYGPNGLSHYALEDVAVMRTLPGLGVVAPADGAQTRAALEKMYDRPEPVFFRLGRDRNTPLPGLDGFYEPGRAAMVRGGRDLLLVTTGNISFDAVEAADKLAEQGIACGVIVAACLNPAPEADLVEALSQ